MGRMLSQKRCIKGMAEDNYPFDSVELWLFYSEGCIKCLQKWRENLL